MGRNLLADMSWLIDSAGDAVLSDEYGQEWRRAAQEVRIGIDDVILSLQKGAEDARLSATNLHPGGPWEYQTGLRMAYQGALAILQGTPLDKLPRLSMGVQ